MVRSYIRGIGAYVPDGVLSNADLEKIVETSDGWITTRSGIKTRHVSDENTPSSELATTGRSRCITYVWIVGKKNCWMI